MDVIKLDGENGERRPWNGNVVVELSKIISDLRSKNVPTKKIVKELNKEDKWHPQDVMVAFASNGIRSIVERDGEEVFFHIDTVGGGNVYGPREELLKLPSIKWETFKD